jgi:hypothetical protein
MISSRAGHHREGPDQLVDPLLPLQPAHEQHRGFGFGFDVAGTEPAQVDTAGHRTAREPRAGAEQLDGAGCGCSDHVGGPVDASEIAPGPPRDPVGEHVRHPGVFEHVLRHEVVRGDGRVPGVGRGREQTATDLEVRRTCTTSGRTARSTRRAPAAAGPGRQARNRSWPGTR